MHKVANTTPLKSSTNRPESIVNSDKKSKINSYGTPGSKKGNEEGENSSSFNSPSPMTKKSV